MLSILNQFSNKLPFLQGSISSQIHKTLGCSDFIQRASTTRVFKWLKVWRFLLRNCVCRSLVPNGDKHIGTRQECRAWGKDPGVDLFALSRYGHCSGHNCELRWFFFKFEVCVLVISIRVLKYNYDKCRQTIWET